MESTSTEHLGAYWEPMAYKGYVGVAEYDHDERIISGRVVGLQRARIFFKAECAADAEREFRASVNFYLEGCAADGEEPEHPSASPEGIGDLSEASYTLTGSLGTRWSLTIHGPVDALPPENARALARALAPLFAALHEHPQHTPAQLPTGDAAL